MRDAKSYLASFGVRPREKLKQSPSTPTSDQKQVSITNASTLATEQHNPTSIASSILDPIQKRTALVKLQGPFSDTQLDSIARGMVYLEKLGLVSVIVVENDEFLRGDERERAAVEEGTMRVVTALEKQGAQARPVFGPVVRLGPMPGVDESICSDGVASPEAHTLPSDLTPIRSALRAGEIPVVFPFALDTFCRSVRINSNDVIAALARGMVEAAASEDHGQTNSERGHATLAGEMDLTPLRLMVINREGGVPSYARSGYPHLLINLESEFSHIQETFREHWRLSNPTALSNLSLARSCLAVMPSTSSAVMVSHRSSSSLIANLITNRPAVSSSLPHALLQGDRKLTPHTPTLVRRGLPIRVLRTTAEIDKARMKILLEQSFAKVLDEEPFYQRLDESLDFIIVAGDYAGVAIVTNESISNASLGSISYLDKFAVLPQNQGDGTVDFLWVAASTSKSNSLRRLMLLYEQLHDESYGLGDSFSVNPNGGKGGKGEGRDLVWRSRSTNPINKWYFERSSGHVRLGSWVLFWCDAEKRLKTEAGRLGTAGVSYVEEWEQGRLAKWAQVVLKVPSSWK
jgi:amino-acid N-acetyltransferase